MSGYAPNPSSAENAAASLTSGLLARKGQATPAVDAMIHEGVDVDLNTNFASRPKPINGGAASHDAGNDASTQNAYPSPAYAQSYNEPEKWEPPAPSQAAVALDAPSQAPVTLDAPPESWTSVSERAKQRLRLRKRSSGDHSAAAHSALRATVKFRMPAVDFMRLRAASRTMKESCQIIILDAIAAYLDANEVEPVDEETARREAARLSRRNSGD